MDEPGPAFGYHLISPKTYQGYLLMKEEHLEEAPVSFESTAVLITSDGRIVLGCPIDTFVVSQTLFKVDIWNSELSILSDIAKIHSRLDYGAIIRVVCLTCTRKNSKCVLYT